MSSAVFLCAFDEMCAMSDDVDFSSLTYFLKSATVCASSGGICASFAAWPDFCGAFGAFDVEDDDVNGFKAALVPPKPVKVDVEVVGVAPKAPVEDVVATVDVKAPKAPDVAVGAPKAPDVAVGAPKAPDVAVGAPKAPEVAVGAPKAPDVAVGAPKAPDVAVGAPKDVDVAVEAPPKPANPLDVDAAGARKVAADGVVVVVEAPKFSVGLVAVAAVAAPKLNPVEEDAGGAEVAEKLKLILLRPPK